MYYTVIKHDGNLRTRDKFAQRNIENTSRRRVFSIFLWAIFRSHRVIFGRYLVNLVYPAIFSIPHVNVGSRKRSSWFFVLTL